MKLNEITIEITQQCLNRCIYCSSLSDIDKKQYLDFDTICLIVDDAKSLGAKSVSLSGGEPFLNTDIIDIVDYIHAKGLKLRLYSSGIYLKGDSTSSIPAAMLEAIKGKVDTLIFNYETNDEDLYATIMGTHRDNLALLEESITNAIAIGIQVEAHLVPMRCNFRQIPDVLGKLYSMGVLNVSFLRLVSQGRVLENRSLVELSLEEQEEFKQILSRLSERYQGKIRLGLPFSSRGTSCGTGTVKLTVRYDGYVLPCEAFKDGMMAISEGVTPDNVKGKRLIDIYETSAYLIEVRENLKAFSVCGIDEYCYGQYCRKNHGMQDRCLDCAGL